MAIASSGCHRTVDADNADSAVQGGTPLPGEDIIPAAVAVDPLSAPNASAGMGNSGMYGADPDELGNIEASDSNPSGDHGPGAGSAPEQSPN